MKEKITEFDEKNMTITNQIFQAGKFPLDPEKTRGIYQVEDLGNNHSKVSFHITFKTQPPWMGGLMKGKFEKPIEDYFIALEHNVKTGEKVSKENFKKIKKDYK